MANNTSSTSLQDAVLNYLIKNKVPVVVVFVGNGAQVHGKIYFHDKYCIFVMDNDKHQNMIYKGALSTISPKAMINMAELTKMFNG